MSSSLLILVRGFSGKIEVCFFSFICLVHYALLSLILRCTLLPCLQVTEVFNFSQEDLLTEDMMILCTHAEVFVWIGHSVESKEKQKAFDIGQVLILRCTFVEVI